MTWLGRLSVASPASHFTRCTRHKYPGGFSTYSEPFVSMPRARAKPEVLQTTLRDEVSTAWDHYRCGLLQQIFSRENSPGTVMLFEFDSKAAAARID
jgi:hypothetical protein